MKLVKPSFKILVQNSNIIDILQHIERCGRICYASLDKITDESYIQFNTMIKGNKHLSVMEHGTVYLYFNPTSREKYFKYCHNPYSIANSIGEAEKGTWEGFVTTNYRVIIENGWEDDIRYLSDPTEYHEKRICVKFICDRGIANELVRHRTMSFSQESSRYCNFSKDKFGNCITYIIPNWTDIPEGELSLNENNYSIGSTQISKHSANGILLSSWYQAEQTYLKLLKNGWKPEQARNVLPLGLSTKLIVTGFKSDWLNLIKLRATPQAHPQMRELILPLKDKLING